VQRGSAPPNFLISHGWGVIERAILEPDVYLLDSRLRGNDRIQNKVFA